MSINSGRGFAIGAALTIALSFSAPAIAGSMHHASINQGIQTGGEKLPGQVLWTYYETTFRGMLCSDAEPGATCNHMGSGDNIIRLVNPNGSANPFLVGGIDQAVCAMIYVFDDDEEMGECCGCSLSPAKLATFSVESNLTSNWGLRAPGAEDGIGAIAIVASAPNVPVSFVPGQSNGKGCGNSNPACNRGCDPTNIPGYTVTQATNLLGSITHGQVVQAGPIWSSDAAFRSTEIALSDDGGGELTNLVYLETQCGSLVGNGSNGAICNCPTE
jgi:hypothetical protein